MPDQGIALPAGQGASKHDQAKSAPIAYTVAQFARLLGKHPNTVYVWVDKGAVPHERIGDSIFIPKWALGCLLTPAEPSESAGADPVVTPAGGEVV
jgi:excisionase family DNA binding protein